MTQTIDYYFSPTSPWAYMGVARFAALAVRFNATVIPHAVNLGEVFANSGGLPLAKRSPQRRAYRDMELRRWREKLQMKLNLQPKFFPAADRLASCLIIAAREQGLPVLVLAEAVQRAVWAEDRNIADPAVLHAIVDEQGLPAGKLMAAAESAAIQSTYDAETKAALDTGVFGSPTYVLNGEVFWGQDRLDFLEQALARNT